jgi:large subunit ribosomal protein L3
MRDSPYPGKVEAVIRHAFKKIGMTSAFDALGNAQGVTILELVPAKVVRHETLSDERKLVIVEYDLGFKKPIRRGYFVDSFEAFPVGPDFAIPSFEPGLKLKVTGSSKGRGFQDVITRHGFSGGPAAHGSRFHRAPGSVGMRTEPGRTPRGKRLPGQDGNVKVSVRNLKVAQWSPDARVLAVWGGVPGARGGLVFV